MRCVSVRAIYFNRKAVYHNFERDSFTSLVDGKMLKNFSFQVWISLKIAEILVLSATSCNVCVCKKDVFYFNPSMLTSWNPWAYSLLNGDGFGYKQTAPNSWNDINTFFTFCAKMLSMVPHRCQKIAANISKFPLTMVDNLGF